MSITVAELFPSYYTAIKWACLRKKCSKQEKIRLENDYICRIVRLGFEYWAFDLKIIKKYKVWVFNNQHRRNGPASIEHYIGRDQIRIMRWYKHGLLHRKDGPAEVSFHMNGKVASEKWYIHGEYYYRDGHLHHITYRETGEKHHGFRYENGKIVLKTEYS